MPKKRKAAKRNLPEGSRVKRRTDGRRATLVYIQPALLVSVKKAALDRQTTAFFAHRAGRRRVAAETQERSALSEL
jgi:hypothetical protein